MKPTLLFISILLAVAANSQTGASISGNVSYFFNSYVGNRADVGSKAYLVDSAGNVVDSAAVDLQGNFKIENVNFGNYLLCVVSKRIFYDSQPSYDNFSSNIPLFQNYFGFSLDSLPRKVNDSLLYYSHVKKIADTTQVSLFAYGFRNKDTKRAEAERREIETMQTKADNDFHRLVAIFFKEALIKYPTLKGIGYTGSAYQHKTYIQPLSINKNDNYPAVIDFGTSYFSITN